jgi:hypothetical protein
MSVRCVVGRAFVWTLVWLGGGRLVVGYTWATKDGLIGSMAFIRRRMARTKWFVHTVNKQEISNSHAYLLATCDYYTPCFFAATACLLFILPSSFLLGVEGELASAVYFGIDTRSLYRSSFFKSSVLAVILH